MGTNYKWRQIDDLSRPYFLNEDDICIYAREHTNGGYEASESNQMLFNYKKPLDGKDKPGWYYKKHSVALFAAELSELNFPAGSVLVPAPTSNPRSSGNFDSRIEDTIIELIKYQQNLLFQPVLDLKQAIPSAHAGGGSRNPFEIKKNLMVSPFTIEPVPKRIFLIDDMITTGGHFRAFKDKLLEKYPSLQVIGIFWAKHVFSD